MKINKTITPALIGLIVSICVTAQAQSIRVSGSLGGLTNGGLAGDTNAAAVPRTFTDGTAAWLEWNFDQAPPLTVAEVTFVGMINGEESFGYPLARGNLNPVSAR